MIASNFLSPLQNQLMELDLDNPFKSKKFRNFPIGIKKIVKLRPQSCNYSETNIFDIPTGIGFLAKITLKFQFTANLTTSKPFLAKRLCKFIYLETKQGSRTIQAIRPEYTTARIDNASSDVTSFYDNTSSITVIPGSNTYTCYNQLFLYISEHPSLFIDLRNTELLQLKTVVNDNYTLMGLDSDITNLTIEPILEVFETDVERTQIKRYLAFDTFYEKEKLLINGDTSTTFKITAKKSVYNIHMLIKSTDQNYIPINSFIMKSNGKEIVNYERAMNYDPWTMEQNLEINNTLTYWFSMFKQRTDNTFMLNLYNLNPLEIEINHDEIPGSNYYLYIFYEYPVLTQINGTKLERITNY